MIQMRVGRVVNRDRGFVTKSELNVADVPKSTRTHQGMQLRLPILRSILV